MALVAHNSHKTICQIQYTKIILREFPSNKKFTDQTCLHNQLNAIKVIIKEHEGTYQD